MKLSALTYNTLFAGRDGSNNRRAQAQIGLIKEVRPDVFLMQEAKGFDANGGAWLFARKPRIPMRASSAKNFPQNHSTENSGEPVLRM